MFRSIKGTVIKKEDRYVVVEANDVGYKLHVAGDTLTKVQEGAKVFFWLHTQAREDALELYGFLAYEELEFFELLIQVSGIGPKGALAILAVASIDILKRAITSGDVTYLTRISGIGKKTAEKIVLDLRDKVGVMTREEKGESMQGELDTLEALKSLGYREHEVREVLKKVKGSDTNTKIREALKILGGR